MNVEDILEERGNTHGNFKSNAVTAQVLKKYVRTICLQHQNKMVAYQAEALDNICQKIARILVGDPAHIDSWVDICGYSQLVVNELEQQKDAELSRIID